jgi:hypothetical protein
MAAKPGVAPRQAGYPQRRGWVSFNAVDNSAITWQPSEWRRDSRMELIFSTPRTWPRCSVRWLPSVTVLGVVLAPLAELDHFGAR